MELDPLGRTALIPFWARADDAISPRPVLADAAAAALAPQIRERFGTAALSRSTRVGCCLRNLIVDRWIAELCDADTSIVEIGVGLNTRAQRMPSAARTYLEVDCAPIIELRDHLLPGRDAVRIAGDGLDVASWRGALKAAHTGRFVICLEGVLAYQQPEAVARFFADLANDFPGAYIMFDRLAPSAVARAVSVPASRFEDRPEYRWPPSGREGEQFGAELTILRAQGFMDLPRRLRSQLPIRDRIIHIAPPRRGAYRLLLCQLAGAERTGLRGELGLGAY